MKFETLKKFKQPRTIRWKILSFIYLFIIATVFLTLYYFVPLYKNTRSLEKEFEKVKTFLFLHSIIDNIIKERDIVLYQKLNQTCQVKYLKHEKIKKDLDAFLDSLNNFGKNYIVSFRNLNITYRLAEAYKNKDLQSYTKIIEDLSRFIVNSVLSSDYPDLNNLYIYLYLSSLYKNYIHLEKEYFFVKYSGDNTDFPYSLDLINKLEKDRLKELKILFSNGKYLQYLETILNSTYYKQIKKIRSLENSKNTFYIQMYSPYKINNIYSSYINLWNNLEKSFITDKVGKVRLEIFKRKITFYETIFGIIIIFLFLFFILLGLYRDINKLLKEINNLFKKISQDSLGNRIKFSQKSELGEISEYINLILDILEKSLKELKITVSHEEIFAQIISHEIKNFLSGILFALEKLLMSKNLNENERKILRDSLKNLNFIKLLLEDLTDLSQIRKKKLIVEPKKVNLNELFQNVVSAILFRKKPNVNFEIKLDNITNYYYVDPKRISQIIINLLSNAFKYTQKGEVDLIVKLFPKNDKEDILYIEVKDTGVGIPEEDKKNIFNLFSRSKLTKDIEGKGIGLYITKNIVEALGGEILCESQEGKGSRFIVKIPIKKAEKISSENSKKYLPCDKVKDLSILVVDDIAFNRELVKLLAKAFGIEKVFEAYDKESLKNILRNQKIDIILLDFYLPPDNAYEILEDNFIRNYIGTYKPYVYILSGENLEVKPKYSFIRGVLKKPLKKEDLENILKNICPPNAG